ncbi:MAG: asparaginase [Candidatus Aminicenantes bacterium]|nr:asparaginase [Candidatus Aminicenantes bacterium]NIM80776.1 asparaginase [Candidatus Aminicenantes bacterium]NIN20158.1 asparaginase [Candidatus Aminicenantes bacterium]NIN43938.1 asparaginase [Candidatus Aminicenantes bacterium]NIN86747.1 asparaginase [Candidatus Aminicenantes bacterium]
MNGQSLLPVPLVEITRGDIVERVHHGHVGVVQADKKILFSLGDPYKNTYMRSAAKPVQVMPLLLSDGDQRFGFIDREIAIMCASHYCEPNHMETLESILRKTNLTEKNLLCGSSYSLKFDYALELAAKHVPLNQLYNDCSGKHLGMLSLCLHRNYPLENYISPDHPVQQEILEFFCDFCEVEKESVGIAIDGCSAPVFSLPLYNMALAYLKLSNPDSFDLDPKTAAVCRKVFTAMTAHPEIISGTGGFCTALIGSTSGKLIGKVGADGIYCVGVKGKGIGLAVKIEDGNKNPLSTVVIEILSNLGILSEAEKAKLKKFHSKDVKNDMQIIVGVQKPCFKIG